MRYLIAQQHILLLDICVIVVKYLFDCDGIFFLPQLSLVVAAKGEAELERGQNAIQEQQKKRI